MRVRWHKLVPILIQLQQSTTYHTMDTALPTCVNGILALEGETDTDRQPLAYGTTSYLLPVNSPWQLVH